MGFDPFYRHKASDQGGRGALAGFVPQERCDPLLRAVEQDLNRDGHGWGAPRQRKANSGSLTSRMAFSRGEGVWPAAVLVDDPVYLTHNSDGFREGDDDLLIVSDVRSRQSPSLSVL